MRYCVASVSLTFDRENERHRLSQLMTARRKQLPPGYVAWLLCCISERPGLERTAELKRLQAHGIDWNGLFRFAEDHDLLALLHTSLQGLSAVSVPAMLSQALSDHYHVSALRNRMQYQEFRKLGRLLEEAGIEFIALKGIVLARHIYPDAAQRQFGDIDLLVREVNIDSAKALLEQQGYAATFTYGIRDSQGDALTPLQESIYRAHYHQYELRSNDGLIYIDLHWRLSPTLYPADLPTPLVWEAADAYEIDGVSIKRLPDELDLLYLCVHGAKDGWSRLKWVVDVDRLLSACPALDWRRVWDFADRCRCRRMLTAGLRLSQLLLGTPLPDAVVATMATDPAIDAAACRLSKRLQSPVEVSHRLPCLGVNRVYLRLCDSSSDALLHFWRALSEPRARDCKLLGLSETLLPFWTWLRPFRIGAHCLRKSLARMSRRRGPQEDG